MAASVEASKAGLEERARVLGVLQQHERELRARGLTRLALFGSTARGDLGPKSDVDLLIEVDPARPFGLFAFVDLKTDLAAILGRPVDLAFPDAKRPRPCFGVPSRSSDGGVALEPPSRTIDNAADPDTRRGTSLRETRLRSGARFELGGVDGHLEV